MYKDDNVKREYFKQRYANNKDMYKKSRNNYWTNYARKKLNKEDVTDEEIRECRNAYYTEYRKNNPDIIQKNLDDFWSRRKAEY